MRYLSLLCLIVCCLACGKNDDPVVENHYYLDSIRHTTFGIRTFDYNAQDLLSTWTCGDCQTAYTLNYSNGAMASLDITNKLSGITEQEATIKVTPTYILKTYRNRADSFVINSKGEITDKYENLGIPNGYNHIYLTWKNGNVVKSQIYYVKTDGTVLDSVVTEWTYDDKKNMYTAAKMITIAYFFSAFNVLSANNAVTQYHISNAANARYSTTFNYEYNSDGYPVKATTKEIQQFGTTTIEKYDTMWMSYQKR